MKSDSGRKAAAFRDFRASEIRASADFGLAHSLGREALELFVLEALGPDARDDRLL